MSDKKYTGPNINPVLSSIIANNPMVKEIESLRAQLAEVTRERDEAIAALTPKPPRDGIYPWAIPLERTVQHAQFWIDGGRKEADKGHAILCVEQAVNHWKNACYHYAEQLLATQAHAARMKEALEEVVALRPATQEMDTPSAMAEIASEALSTPINLDALHEYLAQSIDAIRTRLIGFGALEDGTYIEFLDSVSAAHRAKKEGNKDA